MIDKAKLSIFLNSMGFLLKEVEPFNKWNAKVRRVHFENHPPSMLKTWPFYPLRFSKVTISRRWFRSHLFDCARPFNEKKINSYIKQHTNLTTPDIYIFKKVFPRISLKYWYIMLQEDLCQKGYKDLKIVLMELIELKKYDNVFLMMEKIAKVVEMLFEINVFSNDYYLDNFMVNDSGNIALIDFELSIICHDNKKNEAYRNQTILTLINSFKKLTKDDPDFARGIDPLLAIRN